MTLKQSLRKDCVLCVDDDFSGLEVRVALLKADAESGWKLEGKHFVRISWRLSYRGFPRRADFRIPPAICTAQPVRVDRAMT